jgi:hypothetical protein
VEPQEPGYRHKWFFNAEEAGRFAMGNAERLGLEVVDMRFVFDRGKVSLFRVGRYPWILGYPISFIWAKRRKLTVPFVLLKYGVAVPIAIVEEVIKRAIWGWGNRYRNMFCRNVFVVMEKPSTDTKKRVPNQGL